MKNASDYMEMIYFCGKQGQQVLTHRVPGATAFRLFCARTAVYHHMRRFCSAFLDESQNIQRKKKKNRTIPKYLACPLTVSVFPLLKMSITKIPVVPLEL